MLWRVATAFAVGALCVLAAQQLMPEAAVPQPPAPLADMIAEVNRYATTPFVIAEERLREIRVSGSFRVGDVNSVRFALVGFGMEAAPEAGRIVLR